MEGGLQTQFRVVQPVGIQFHFGAAGASTKEVDHTASTNHLHGPLPGLRAAHSFNHNIGAASFGSANHGLYRVLGLFDLDHVVSAEAFGGGNLLIALDHGHYVAAAQFGYLHQHQSQG